MSELQRGSSQITLQMAKQRLKEANLSYAVLPLSEDAKLLIMEHGGRIFGPFTAKESVLWMPSRWDSLTTWKESWSQQYWNLGGERLWIAPEIQYCIKDRNTMSTSWSLPPAMDPSNYHLTYRQNDNIQLETEMSLVAHHHNSQEQHLYVKRIIEPLQNPLRTLIEHDLFMAEVAFSGYQHTIHLETDTENSCLSEAWSIMQVRQGGISIIPTYGTPQIGWYYRPEKSELINQAPPFMLVQHKPGNLFKIGIHSTACTGRVGYLHLQTERPYLLVRNYLVNPSATYVEEPFDAPGEKGYAFHLYNSADLKEQFGEIECHGNAIGGKTGKRSATSTLETWLFEGKREQLELITQKLLSYQIT